ncbi:MAG TPA: hypothetical protein VHM65_00870, partial [Candidatus Lustribacter sp.]|nr:hypothetical protein [Candidatus Lustribacter sp.]
MELTAYRDVLAVREARSAMLLGFVIRIPMFAASVILTIHIVSTLRQTYGAAGVATMVVTVALAVSGPWRGRLLDRIGLRRTMTPSIVAQAVCWSIAPFVSYGPLLVLAGLGALFA